MPRGSFLTCMIMTTSVPIADLGFGMGGNIFAKFPQKGLMKFNTIGRLGTGSYSPMFTYHTTSC